MPPTHSTKALSGRRNPLMKFIFPLHQKRCSGSMTRAYNKTVYRAARRSQFLPETRFARQPLESSRFRSNEILLLAERARAHSSANYSHLLSRAHGKISLARLRETIYSTYSSIYRVSDNALWRNKKSPNFGWSGEYKLSREYLILILLLLATVMGLWKKI